jgi:hypothetical protein
MNETENTVNIADNLKNDSSMKPEDIEMLKIRFGFAWNWFELHAKQRMSLFNFFLLITGILVNAYVIAVIQKIGVLPLVICIVGFIQSIGFIIFDVRSRKLTKYGEDVMEKLEREYLYQNNFSHPDINDGKTLGLLRRDADNKMREGQKGKNFLFYLKRINKMKFWIRLIQLLVCAAFFLGIAILIFQ